MSKHSLFHRAKNKKSSAEPAQSVQIALSSGIFSIPDSGKPKKSASVIMDPSTPISTPVAPTTDLSTSTPSTPVLPAPIIEPIVDKAPEPTPEKPTEQPKEQAKEQSKEKPAFSPRAAHSFPVGILTVKTYDELLDAVKSQQTQIIIGADIVIPETLVLNYDVAINLNGYSLIYNTVSYPSTLLEIRHGDVHFFGNGRLCSLVPDSVAIRIFGASAPSLDGFTSLDIAAGVSVYAPLGTALNLSPNLGSAYGVKVTIAGRLMAHTGIRIAESVQGTAHTLPTFLLEPGSQIISDNNQGIGIEASGPAIWQLNQTQIFAETGLIARAGSFLIQDSDITAGFTALQTPLTSTNPISLTIRGGSFASEKGITFIAFPDAIHRFVIESGSFYGALGVINPEIASSISVLGGEFSADVYDDGSSEVIEVEPATKEQIPDISRDSTLGEFEEIEDTVPEPEPEPEDTLIIEESAPARKIQLPVASAPLVLAHPILEEEEEEPEDLDPRNFGRNYLIDEFSPSTKWSTGAVSIDEATPDRYAGRPLRRKIRNSLASSGIASVLHDIGTGIKIGFDGIFKP